MTIAERIAEQFPVGSKVRYVGPENPSPLQQKLIGKTGIVERIIKTRKMIRLRWDEPAGPMTADKTYEAFATSLSIA